MGYLDYAGLQYLWGKLKEKFAPKSHTHDDRYYTESEMDGKLNSKVNNNEEGANGLLSKLTTSWTATPTDNTYFIRQDTGGGNSFGRVKFSTLWNYIKGKADGVYQPKGSYAASSHTHDDRYYTESEINTKLSGYLPTSGGTMGGTAKISWPDSGNWSKKNDGVTFPVKRGGLSWTGQSDGIDLYGEETGNDNLDLVLKFTDDNSNSLRIVNASGTTTAKITATGTFTGKASTAGIADTATTATSATTSNGVKDYNDANKTIQIGYAGSVLTASNLNYVAGYTDKPVVIGYTIAKSVPADAKFTDTNTWRGIQDNLTSNSKDQGLSAAQGKALKTLVDGKAAVGHTHNSVKDAGDNSSNTTFAYSKSGMNYGDYSWLAGWNGYELRAINKNQFATAGHNHDSRYYTESEIDSKLDDKSNVGHTHDYLPTAGGTMNGTITFSDSSHGKIYSGPTDNVNGPGGDLNNIVIESWNGLSFTTGCPNQTYTGKTAVGIDCREGVVKAARFDGTLTGTAATLGGGGNPYAPMTFNWSGKDGQPTWLWGGEDGTNMYVYNPGNFKVNWAQSAANGVYANGFDGSGGGYIRFCNGAQICWGRTNCSGKDTTINFSAAFSNSSYSVSTMPFYSSLADTYWNVKEGSMGTTGFVLHGSKSSIDLRTMLWIAIGKWN